MQSVSFYKYHGAGNDFILIDDRNGLLEKQLSQAQIARWCGRRYGVGADGLMLLQAHDSADFKMVYYNSDGNYSSMCGNGGRCIALFAYDLKLVEDQMTFMAVDGLHSARVLGEQVHLGMQNVSKPIAYGAGWTLDTGSPHYVEYVDDFPADFVQSARSVRYNDRYKDEGINVNYVVRTTDGLLIRTYERGVEAETHACGTGVTAAALLEMFQTDSDREVLLKAVGGRLRVKAQMSRESTFTDVFLIGPAVRVFSGVLSMD